MLYLVLSGSVLILLAFYIEVRQILLLDQLQKRIEKLEERD